MATVVPFVDPFSGSDTSRSSLPLRSPYEDCEDIPPEPPAVIRGLVVLGSMTEVSAYIRVGKTVFILMLAKASLERHTFLGRPTSPAFWVYVTEEGRPSFADALRKAGMDAIGPNDMLILHRREARKLAWPDLIRGLVTEARQRARGRYIVLVIDTLMRCAGLGPEQEKDAGQAALVMDPLTEVIGPDLAIISGRHDRKAGGEVGESARGSSAFSGDMDVLLQLRRPTRDGEDTEITSTNVRVLSAASRFSSTPAQDEPIKIRLADRQYSILGDTDIDQQRYMRLDEQILLFIASHLGVTRRELQHTAAIRGKATLRDERLTTLIENGKVIEQAIDKQDRRGRTYSSKGLFIGPFA